MVNFGKMSDYGVFWSLELFMCESGGWTGAGIMAGAGAIMGAGAGASAGGWLFYGLYRNVH